MNFSRPAALSALWPRPAMRREFRHLAERASSFVIRGARAFADWTELSVHRDAVPVAEASDKYEKELTAALMIAQLWGHELAFDCTLEDFEHAFPRTRPDAARPFYNAVETLATNLAKQVGPHARILDVGCGAGTSLNLALSEHVAQVTLVDASARLVDAVNTLARGETLHLHVPVCGTATISATLRRPPTPGAKAMVGDALALPFANASQDLVTDTGLLDRLRDPHRHLLELARIVRPGGALLVSCIHDWVNSPAPRRLHIPSVKALLAADAGWERVRLESLPDLVLWQGARVTESFSPETVVAIRSAKRA